MRSHIRLYYHEIQNFLEKWLKMIYRSSYLAELPFLGYSTPYWEIFLLNPKPPPIESITILSRNAHQHLIWQVHTCF